MSRPKGKRAFASVTWPGLIGVLSGQSASLAAAVMVVHGDSGARAGISFTFLFRKLLETCDDVKQAEALLRKAPLTVTNNLMVVDAKGGSRVFELHPDGIGVRKPKRERLVATNHFLTKKRWRPRASFEAFSSLLRFDAVEQTCPAGPGPVTLEQARASLAAASTPYTAQSMVFLPAKGELEVAFTRRGSAARARFVRIPKARLLGP